MKLKRLTATTIVALVVLGNDAAVAPHGVFSEGLLSRTSPGGWLARCCDLQREGLTGHPEALGYPYDTCLWAGTIPRQGEHGEAWWRYEQTAYYVDGLLRLGYATGDSELIRKGESNVDWVLEHASPEGYLGDECLWKGGKGEMWPMAVFFRAMKAKFDATGDPRIPAALAKYYRLHSPEILRRGRNTVHVEGLCWTFGKTGDRELLRVAEEAWKQKSDTKDCLTPTMAREDAPFHLHGVTVCEQLKIPLLLFAYTGKGEYLEQARNLHRRLVRDHWLPDGCISSTEQTRGNSVQWGHETCDVSDYTWTLGYFLEMTGEADFADRIERCVFNAGPGAVNEDFRSFQYFSNINQVIATRESNHNPYAIGWGWTQYRPRHDVECCAGNVHRFIPNYISRMFLKDRDGNPVAALYGPAEVDYGWVKIREETRYPFDGKVRFVFSLAEPKSFSFTYRVPGWCESHPEHGRFVTVTKTFRDGETLDLDFPMEVVYEKPAPRKLVFRDDASRRAYSIEGAASQGVVVRRGPILYSWPVPTTEREETVAQGFSNHDKRPSEPFGYALTGYPYDATVSQGDGDCAFDWRRPMTTVRVPARRIRWELDEGRFTPDLPRQAVAMDDETVWLTLVPYGSTCLRLTAFPDLTCSGETRVAALYVPHDKAYWAKYQRDRRRPLGGCYVSTNPEDFRTERELAENAGIGEFVQDAAEAEAKGFVRVKVDADDAKFERHLREAREKFDRILIDSWNDFGNGECLLPDTRSGDLHLRAVARVFGRHPTNRYVYTEMRHYWEGDKAVNQRAYGLPAPTVENVKYGPHPRQGFDLWLPGPAATSGRKTPLAVIIHGGGWENGDRNDEIVRELLPKCQKAGIAVATVGYRFLSNAAEQGVDPPVMGPLEDAVAAVRLMKDRAKEWHLDVSRIGLTGGSAGAFSSLYCGLAQENELGIHTVFARVPQTTIDPVETREWIPNAWYGAAAFGLDSFDEFLRRREELLPRIKMISPIQLLRDIPSARAPNFLYWRVSLPVAGELPKDPTHAGIFCVKFKEACDSRGVWCARGEFDDFIRILREGPADCPAHPGRKRLLVIGDSITAARQWQMRTAELLGWDVRTHAKSGACILPMVDGDGKGGAPADYDPDLFDPNRIYPLAESDVRDVDAVVLMGFYNERPNVRDAKRCGLPTDMHPMQQTFCGRLNYAIRCVREKLSAVGNPHCPIILVAPHRYGKNRWIGWTSEEDGQSMVAAIAAIAEKNGLPFVNLMEKCDIDRSNWDRFQASPTPFADTYLTGDGKANDGTNRPFPSVEVLPDAAKHKNRSATVRGRTGCFVSDGIAWNHTTANYPWFADQLHLNECGYRRIGEVIAMEIGKLLRIECRPDKCGVNK